MQNSYLESFGASKKATVTETVYSISPKSTQRESDQIVLLGLCVKLATSSKGFWNSDFSTYKKVKAPRPPEMKTYYGREHDTFCTGSFINNVWAFVSVNTNNKNCYV